MSTDNGVPVTTAPQSYSDSALARVQEIRAMRDKIPNLVIPETRDARRRLAAAASVPQEFVELTSMAVKSNTTLVRGGGQDLAANSDLKSYADAYGPVADELEALASFMRHSVTKAKNTVGSEALTTYALARRLSKRPEMADLIPHVDDMGKALGRRNRKSKAQPAPAPVTPVTTTQPSPVTPTSPTAGTKTTQPVSCSKPRAGAPQGAPAHFGRTKPESRTQMFGVWGLGGRDAAKPAGEDASAPARQVQPMGAAEDRIEMAAAGRAGLVRRARLRWFPGLGDDLLLEASRYFLVM